MASLLPTGSAQTDLKKSKKTTSLITSKLDKVRAQLPYLPRALTRFVPTAGGARVERFRLPDSTRTGLSG